MELNTETSINDRRERRWEPHRVTFKTDPDLGAIIYLSVVLAVKRAVHSLHELPQRRSIEPMAPMQDRR